jgi:hypothetical protein
MPLALPKHVYDEFKRWDGTEVSVAGIAYAHGVADDVIVYKLQGRDVTGALCRSSSVVLFVRSVKRL